MITLCWFWKRVIFMHSFPTDKQRSSFLTFRVQSLFYTFKTVRMLLVEPCANFNYFYFDLLKTSKREECYLAICFGVASDVNKINPHPPKSLPCPTQQTDSRRLFPSHFHLALLDQLSSSHSEHLTHASPQWFLLSPSPVLLQYHLPHFSTAITLNIHHLAVSVNWVACY